MRYYKDGLIHPPSCFKQKTILARKKKLGLTNAARMELFIWDLEIFCQIQRILGNNIVLKGGTAAQLYIPVERQRTSIDIDMICKVQRDEVESCLKNIEDTFKGEGNVLKFRFHKPKNAKTELPLLTCYTTIPSEIIKEDKKAGTQEIKVEFFFHDDEWPAIIMKKPSVFALETDQDYRILSLEGLIADKFTTIGPNTIGIPISRRDEICKQIYDLDALLHFANNGVHNVLDVRNLYIKRAQLA